jgi:hypothetical protein
MNCIVCEDSGPDNSCCCLKDAKEAERLAARAMREFIHESDIHLYEYRGAGIALESYDAARAKVDSLERGE